MSTFSSVCLEILIFLILVLILLRLRAKLVTALDMKREEEASANLFFIAPFLLLARLCHAINIRLFPSASLRYDLFAALLLTLYAGWMLYASFRLLEIPSRFLLLGLLPCLLPVFLRQPDIYEKTDLIFWILSLEILLATVFLLRKLLKLHSLSFSTVLRTKASAKKKSLGFWTCLHLIEIVALLAVFFYSRYYLEPLSQKAWKTSVSSCGEVYEITGVIYWNRDSCAACENIKLALKSCATKADVILHSFNTDELRDDPQFDQVLSDFGITEVPYLTLVTEGQVIAGASLVSALSQQDPAEQIKDILKQYKELP